VSSRRIIVLIGAFAIAGVLGSAAQGQTYSPGGNIRYEASGYSCAQGISQSYVNACVDMKNNINVFTAPGKLSMARPLRLIRVEEYCKEDPYATSTNIKTFRVVKTVPGGTTGGAGIEGPYMGYSCNDGLFFWAMQRQSGVPVDYQTLVVARILDQPKNQQELSNCLGEGYLACSMGPNIDNTGDNKNWRVATVTSRPLDVKIINSLGQPLIRDDGPYWTKALRAQNGDNAARIAAATTAGPGVGNSGALRSIFRTSGYAAVYRVGMGADPANSPYAGAAIAINITVGPDGKTKSTCTPLGRPTAPFSCSIDFSGIYTGVLTATIRVRAN
jgi:hypothetical protein